MEYYNEVMLLCSLYGEKKNKYATHEDNFIDVEREYNVFIQKYNVRIIRRLDNIIEYSDNRT